MNTTSEDLDTIAQHYYDLATEINQAYKIKEIKFFHLPGFGFKLHYRPAKFALDILPLFDKIKVCLKSGSSSMGPSEYFDYNDPNILLKIEVLLITFMKAIVLHSHTGDFLHGNGDTRQLWEMCIHSGQNKLHNIRNSAKSWKPSPKLLNAYTDNTKTSTSTQTSKPTNKTKSSKSPTTTQTLTATHTPNNSDTP